MDLEVSDEKKKDENIHIKNITLDISLGQVIFEKAIIDNLQVDGISFPTKQLEEKTKNISKEESKTTNNTKKSTEISDLNTLKNIEFQKDFDKEIKNRFDEYKGFYEQLKPLFNKEQEIVAKRDEGIYIYYQLESLLPQILIRQGTFSIIKDELLINGTFKDFTTNQYLYKKPFIISIDTKSNKIGNVLVDGSFIETKQVNKDKLNIKLNGYSVPNKEEKSFSISNTIINTEIDLNIIKKNEISGSQSIDVISTDIKIPESNKYIEILNKSLIKTKGINANVGISGTLNSPKFNIDSNIDSILKKKVKSVLSSQQDAIKNEVKEKVQEKVKEKLNGKLKGILGF